VKQKTSIFNFIALTLLCTSLSANSILPKQSLKTNGQVVHNSKPSLVSEFSDMFSEGLFYGRLRTNNFYYDWREEDGGHSSHFISGVGASLVYNSATFNHVDFGLGLYGSQAFFNASSDPVAQLKSGKDVLSRFEYINTGSKGMGVVGQAFLRYRGLSKSQFTVGRQLVESFYTKSNDTKMIPNTFDGLVFATKIISKTDVKIAYLYQQKLRDHTQAHGVLVVGDAMSSSSLKPQWSQNDDAGMHKGLTYSALKLAGKPTDTPLIVGDFKNKSIANLRLDASFYIVPELVSQIMTELNYSFKLASDFSITPGVRYIRQFDNGAGEVGGASITGNSLGYADIDSVNSQMLAARVVTKIENYKLNLGFTYVLDEADLITPWRGFPTSGYTRSMGRYNWRANTKSYRLELVRNANSQGIYKNLFIQASVLYTDGDESKVGINDELYYYIGFVQNIPSLVNLQWRLRVGYADYLDTLASKLNNLDSRFEINYLF
jgi:hypothetical protein